MPILIALAGLVLAVAVAFASAIGYMLWTVAEAATKPPKPAARTPRTRGRPRGRAVSYYEITEEEVNALLGDVFRPKGRKS